MQTSVVALKATQRRPLLDHPRSVTSYTHPNTLPAWSLSGEPTRSGTGPGVPGEELRCAIAQTRRPAEHPSVAARVRAKHFGRRNSFASSFIRALRDTCRFHFNQARAFSTHSIAFLYSDALSKKRRLDILSRVVAATRGFIPALRRTNFKRPLTCSGYQVAPGRGARLPCYL